MYVSLFNLLGLPILRGFYSKDFVLESINYSFRSLLILSVMFLNVFFTYYYTYQLFYYSFASNKVLPFQLYHTPGMLHASMLSLLAFSTLFFPGFLLRIIYYSTVYLPVPSSFKFFPIFLNVTVFIFLLIFLKQFTLKSKLPSAYFSRIMFLSPFMITLMSNFYYSRVVTFVKSFELGVLNYSFNSFLPGLVFSSSKWLVSLCYSGPLRLVLFSLPVIVLLAVF